MVSRFWMTPFITVRRLVVFLPMEESRVKVLLATLMALALLGACGGGGGADATNDTAAEDVAADPDESPAEDEAEPGTLEFSGTEYAFSAPPTAAAGETSITLVNNGDEPHMLDLVPLTPDAPAVEKLIKMPEKKLGKFFAGEPIHIDTIKPGETSEPVEAELKPGRYGYVCFFSKKGEKPHAFLGMYGELTVE